MSFHNFLKKSGVLSTLEVNYNEKKIIGLNPVTLLVSPNIEEVRDREKSIGGIKTKTKRSKKRMYL